MQVEVIMADDYLLTLSVSLEIGNPITICSSHSSHSSFQASVLSILLFRVIDPVVVARRAAASSPTPVNFASFSVCCFLTYLLTSNARRRPSNSVFIFQSYNTHTHSYIGWCMMLSGFSYHIHSQNVCMQAQKAHENGK